MELANPIVTITTIAGHRVSAPLAQWVQALLLRLSPTELVEVLVMVERAHAPDVVVPRDTVEADPEAWLRGFGQQERT